MGAPLDVCIRGAGIVGRTLALLLARDRLRVGLVEQPDGRTGSQSDVRAYALNTASAELLQRLRAWPDEAHATPVLGMAVQGDDGGQVRFNAADEGVPALAWIVEVEPLLARLAEAVRFQPQVEPLQAPQAAALTIVCEGRAAATRAEFGVQFDVTSYPQRAIAARLQCENGHGQVARQWFSDGDVLALLPLGGPQGNSAALVWSVQEARADELLAMPAAEFEGRLQAASGGALGRMTLISERAAWPLQRAQADRWCGPGWALAGDAAHNVHPLAGQGLNLGLADARQLADVLHAREYWRGLGDARLLRRYERARKADVLAMGWATDGLQQVFAQPAEAWALLRNWGMRGFDRSGPLKHWAVRQAMGRAAPGLTWTGRRT
ncbi:ubiquinone biosynthesis protein UbiH [Caenimonas sedimenti]|uniref:Ubiquinone biosynthesis protein UbiH n=1 Tax=Caenimonas sedimenti TaxID=2596921 RepID=A0A562ZPF1_9BURK|nr:FAD-dependent monooxygenase [Caenimonas sedimenti]TWO70440.1 ubiquinone biosynthesis protein UbiH [Caenimonas sedimenti]